MEDLHQRRQTRQQHVLHWIINECIQLVPPITIVRKPLQMDNENLWQIPDVELFSCLLVFLTGRTIPGHKNTVIIMDEEKIQYQKLTEPQPP